MGTLKMDSWGRLNPSEKRGVNFREEKKKEVEVHFASDRKENWEGRGCGKFGIGVHSRNLRTELEEEGNQNGPY